ncbi:hypothetical protein AW872_16020 [Aeromonas hydrophila]|nr:hypothetical protein AS145_02330 [Aeromonas hydrophila]ALZ78513.1 hypothetical protein AhyD4_02335 [Aeromonas hydrophila]ANR98509.1 hypothetical protein A9258_02135 [Aeromonas hydrophila]AXV28387.1 hypothetical protein BFW97_02125 [Aeromonas hydrophila]KYQ08578.1 hypothetical protein AW872_16020 [Aeromonas hydrophila]
MADDAIRRNGGVMARQGSAEPDQCLVLCIRVGLLIGPFQLDPDGKVVARLASLPTRYSRMPGSGTKRHILHQLTVAPDQAVCRDPQLMDTGKIGMSVGSESPKEKIIDEGTAKLARRQADAMHHQQGDIARGGPLVVVR